MKPKPQSRDKTAHTLRLLRRMWLSPLRSAELGGCLSLSQRVGEFRKQGIAIRARWVESHGSRFLEYRAG